MLNSLLKTVRFLKSAAREKSKSTERSPHWDSVRDRIVKERGACEACGSNKRLQVHHIAPFHLRPELELDVSNLIVLCMDETECHLNIGHGGSFKSYNPDVVESAKKFLADSSARGRELIVESCKQRRKEA
jgi:HNH endonuclease